MTTFTAETFQNEYLPVGGSEVNAVITVSASDEGTPSGAAAPPGAGSAAEVIIVDVSGSMASPRSKITEAKRATSAAIDCLRDGVLFGILAGTERADHVYPPGDALVPASPETRAAAKAAVEGLRAEGGTAMGRWLSEASAWFSRHPGTMCHAILLTDGRNEGETPEYLRAVLDMCRSSFQCDCRGIGTDWRVAELRQIASTLLGTVDIVAQPEDLAADFSALMLQAMGKQVADVSLRVWVPRGASIGYLRQVAPTIEDLTARAVPVDDRTVDFPTGAWGSEARDYHLNITVTPRGADEEMLAGRVSLVVDGQVVSQSLVKATWTEEVALSTRIHPQVAHYTGQAELASAIAEGLAARSSGDVSTATARLGRAAQLAAESGHDGTLRLLAKVVDIEDAHTGTVRLKRQVDAADEMALDTRSTKTVRVRPES